MEVGIGIEGRERGIDELLMAARLVLLPRRRRRPEAEMAEVEVRRAELVLLLLLLLL